MTTVRRIDRYTFEVFFEDKWAQLTFGDPSSAGLRDAAFRDEARSKELARSARRTLAVAEFVAIEEAEQAERRAAERAERRWCSTVARRAKRHRWCPTCVTGETHVCGGSLGCKGGHCSVAEHQVSIRYSLGTYYVQRRET